ncbi:MAG TPA: nucleotidyl transferase AbiEii/AbiGii toxin family protein [Bacteroidota bacterium]|jgi:hypothetical protein|nr:nucleotidyl transferase AbiEii/AbiGii toxin family protein [Bacteroidota bacterium]
MSDQLNDFEEFFELLNRHKARFLIIGGYALAFHGRPRYTDDIDILIDSTPTNAGRALKAVEAFGFKNIGITKEDFLKPNFIIQLGYPPLRIDILTGIVGVTFDRAWKGRLAGKFGKQQVWYISRDDLISNKLASGRSQDITDVKSLRRSQRKRK